MEPYIYAAGNLLDKRNTYFYSAYEGSGFLEAWKESRSKYIVSSSSVVYPPEPVYIIELGDLESAIEKGSVIETQAFLDTLYYHLSKEEKEIPAMVFELVDLLVQRFEVSKRIHESYGERFRPVNNRKYKNLELYIRAAEVFDLAFSHHRSLPYINVFLKCIDSLCSIFHMFDSIQKTRISSLVAQELNHVKQLSNSVGVSL